MSKLIEALLVCATPLLLATTKKKAAPKKKAARKPSPRARKPRTEAAHGMSSDMRPIESPTNTQPTTKPSR